MFRNIFCALVFYLFPVIVVGQSISVSVDDATRNNQNSEFSLKGGTITLGTTVSFGATGKTVGDFEAYGISPDFSLVGLLSIESEDRVATMLNTRGDTLTTYGVVNFRSGEQSLKLYPFNTGGSLIRNNIANFNIYNSFGEILNNVSSASSSADGQVISEVAMNVDGSAVAIFTPTIKFGSGTGSRIQFLQPDMTLENIYLDRQRTIKTLEISKNGQFLVFVTEREGEDDIILVIDRHGNELAEIQTSENIQGVAITDNGQYITASSSQRVVIYNTQTGERDAGTSLSEEVLEARYFSDDETILVLTGTFSEQTRVADNLRFHAIHTALRQVARTDFQPGQIGFDEALPKQFVRMGNNQYVLRGGSKLINISTSF